MEPDPSPTLDIEPLGPGEGLKCPMCVEFFTSPRTLSCLHTFCQRCLQLYITDMKASARDGIITSLFCPVCRQLVKSGDLQRAPDDIVSEFPLNKLMSQSTDEFSTPEVNNWQKEKKKFVHFTQYCGFCSKDNLKVMAKTYCHGCGEFRCRHCKDKHVEGDRIRDVDHDVVDIEEMSAVTSSKLSEAINKYTMCKEHTDQELKFYCTDHELLLCRECDVTSHMRCRLAEDFEGLSKSVTQLHETSKMRDEMETLQQDLGFMVETLRDNNTEIHKQSQSVSAKVHSMKETIIQLFEELEESASGTIKRSREHVAKQNSGKAFKMKQLMSAIEGSCSLLDSVSEHGTHRQLLTVFQKLKQQLQTYVSLVNQEKDALVRTSIVMEIDNDLESLIGGFDKIGDVRLESDKVEVPIREKPVRKTSDIVKQNGNKEQTENTFEMGYHEEDGRLVRDSLDGGKTDAGAKSKELFSGNPYVLSEKETQTDLALNNAKLLSPTIVDIDTQKKNSGTQFNGSDIGGSPNQLKGFSGSENEGLSHHGTQTQPSTSADPADVVRASTDMDSLDGTTKRSNEKLSKPGHNPKSIRARSKADTVTVSFKKDSSAAKDTSMDNSQTNEINTTLPLSETISQFDTDISIVLEIDSLLIQSKDMKQDNPHKSRHVIAVCTIREAIILVFKTVKRTGISFNIVALGLSSLNEFKTIEIKKDPKQIIAYDGKHFAITFPDSGYVDFFSYKSPTPRKKKKPGVPADISLEKSVKCDIRSAMLCKYRTDEFGLSTSNYFGTLSYDGTVTKLFFYSMSLRTVETNFWRTQLSVVKMTYDPKNEIIYAATSKPYKLFAFTVFGEVMSESVLDAEVTSLELDRRGSVYVCYNNGVDGVGRIRQVVINLDGQRTVKIENKNPCFVIVSRKTKRFHVVENKMSGTRIEEYELDVEFPDGDALEPEDTESITTA